MDDLQGRVLDRKYRLVRLIGEGGMGSVWEAEHTMISRHVAVKVMRAKTGDEQDIIRRFFLEAQSASAIGHPNIVEIFDVGVEDDGTAFIVMELLTGTSLENLLLDRGYLPPARTIEIILPILSALHAAHRKGIVHRDLKPDNVFLSIDPRMREDPKLLDFGVAKVLHVTRDSLKLTKPGAVMGTAHYLSPEQARGRKDIDSRVDIWAVGVIMYEMLSGHLAFDGDNYNEIIGKILMDRPTSLSDLVPDIPKELVTIVEKAMTHNREDRYQTVSEMIKALLPLNDHLGGHTRGPSLIGARRPSDPGSIASIFKETLTALPYRAVETEQERTTDDIIQVIHPPRLLNKRLLISGAVAVGAALCAIALVALLRDDPSEDISYAAQSPPKAPLYQADRYPKEPGDLPGAAEYSPGIGDQKSDRTGPDTKSTGRLVTIYLKGLPARAKVWLGTERVFAPFKVGRSEKGTTLKITAPGYAPLKKVFVPNRSKILNIEMTKLPGKTGTKPSKDTPRRGWKDNPFD